MSAQHTFKNALLHAFFAVNGPSPGVPLPALEETLRPAMESGRDQRDVVSALPPEEQPETGPVKLPPQFRRTEIAYQTKESVGTIIVDTSHTYLYLVTSNGKAMRYGIGVGREGFTWAGTERTSHPRIVSAFAQSQSLSFHA